MSLESPNYYDSQDKALYEELFNKPDEQLTEVEKSFVRSMYHMEECAAGLDGDY